MELLEAQGLGLCSVYRQKIKKDNDDTPLPSQELLEKRPDDPRAWHCKTVEEYRLWKYSSDYTGLRGGGYDFGADIDHDSHEIYLC